MNNFGSGMVTGYIIANTAATMNAANQSTRRKLQNKGKDQLLFVIKDHINTVGEKIAKVKDKWYWNKEEKKIYVTKPKYSIISFIVALFFTFIVAGFICWLIRDTRLPQGQSNNLLYSISFSIAIILSILLGWGLGGDADKDEITLKDKNNKTLIQIQVFGNDDGNRLFSEIEIFEIVTAIGLDPVLLQSKEA